MRINLSDKAESFLEQEAKKSGLAPEEFAQKIIEDFIRKNGDSDFRFLSYEDLLKRSQAGTKEERIMAGTMRMSFIR